MIPKNKMISEKIFISQAENYAGNFGEVFRSSAIFWVKNNRDIKTTISFSNYWRYKNFLDVKVLINIRKLNGELLKRILVDFDATDVQNFVPQENFEGSVEIETFSIKNLRIPYAAIMAVYECKDSISMVHSYARTYSQHEIEEGRTITIGEESCWTLRDSDTYTSFAVIHNGSSEQEGQKIKIRVRNHRGNEVIQEFEIPKLAPYETFILEPKKYVNDLIEWLDGKPGNARISFRLNGAFTRMLCGIKNLDLTQLQLTHSNFDYSTHKTDVIKGGVLFAYMLTPNLRGNISQEVVVYPDSDEGDYLCRSNQKLSNFKTGQIYTEKFDTNMAQMIQFERSDNILPSRIVTGLRLNSKVKSTIPAECSLGVVHNLRPKKNFAWMLVSEKFKTQISWIDFKEVYGGCPAEAEFTFKLYSSTHKDPLITTLKKSELPANNNFYLIEIYEYCDKFLGDEFGWLTVYCSYGGLGFFSTLEKESSITLEHAF